MLSRRSEKGEHRVRHCVFGNVEGGGPRISRYGCLPDFRNRYGVADVPVYRSLPILKRGANWPSSRNLRPPPDTLLFNAAR